MNFRNVRFLNFFSSLSQEYAVSESREIKKKGIGQNRGMGQSAKKCDIKPHFYVVAFYVYDASSSNFSGRANVYARIWLTATFHASLVGWISFLLQKNERDGSWRYMRYVHDASVRIPLVDKENLELQDSSANRPRNGITFLSYLFSSINLFSPIEYLF